MKDKGCYEYYMVISKWFVLLSKKQKKAILKNEMKNVRCQLVNSLRDDNHKKRDELLNRYELLLVEFKSLCI